MKRKLGLLLPLFLLTSCAQSPLAPEVLEPEQSQQVEEEAFTPYIEVINGLPTIFTSRTADIKVYLLLGNKNASVTVGGTKKSGGVVEGTFYDNAIEINGQVGDAIPDADPGVDGATFRGWAFYNEENENVWPDYYKTLENGINGLALKAIYDGTKTSGGGSGGGGGGGGGGGQPVVQANYGIKFSDGRTVAGTESGTDTQGRKQYLISGQAFNVGESFSLWDSSTDATWAIDLDPWSLGSTDGNPVWTNYLTKGTSSYHVDVAFTGDLYIKLSMEVGDQLYIGLK